MPTTSATPTIHNYQCEDKRAGRTGTGQLRDAAYNSVTNLSTTCLVCNYCVLRLTVP
jgi:hypothetical protein